MLIKFLFIIFIGVSCAFFIAGIGIIFYRQKTINMLKKEEPGKLYSKIRNFVSYIRDYFVKLNGKMTGNKRYSDIRNLLYRINYEEKISAEYFLFTEECVSAAVLCVTLAATGNLLLCFAAGGAAFFIPELILKARVKNRTQEILKEMADGIDIMGANIEGGLSLSASIARFSTGSKGAFAEELTIAVKQTQIGRSFEEAMRKFEEKISLPELTGFIDAVIQADKMGGSIKEIIKAQAAEIRQKRFQYLKKKAHEAPVKLLIPLMLFIFPVIFIILFAPIVIKLIQGI